MKDRNSYGVVVLTMILLSLGIFCTEEPPHLQKNLRLTLLGTWFPKDRCPPSQRIVFTPDSFICDEFTDTLGFSDSMLHVKLKTESRGTWRAWTDNIDPDIQYAYGNVELAHNEGFKEIWNVYGEDTLVCVTFDNHSPCTMLRKDYWYFQVFKQYGKGLVIHTSP
jgi:hypothetical protein